jgi:Putative peptidoglycan binding domain
LRRIFGVAAVLVLMMAAGIATGTGPAEAASSCTSYSTFEEFGTPDGFVIWDQRLPTVGFNTFDASCVLGVGNQGSAVKTLQHALNRCYAPPYNNITAVLTEDGKFGSKTQAAVRAVQTFNGIPHDGVYGPQTRRFMNWPSTDINSGAVGCLLNFVDWPID